ncbi:MAG: Hsp20 family protein [Alphaproteobacteria bacterium]
MRNYDLSPLFRTTVGFDRMNRLFDAVLSGVDSNPTYPPYNIEKVGENQYRITMAVAGFGEDDIDLVQQDDILIVRGKAGDREEGVHYLHRGIAARAFERRFVLADHVNVSGARLENGMLSIELARELPEAMKPRAIPVQVPSVIKKIARKKAA